VECGQRLRAALRIGNRIKSAGLTHELHRREGTHTDDGAKEL
jgi:hypothetical protein